MTNGRSAEVAALLAAARAVVENRAFGDAARAILTACEAILAADAGLVAVSSPGGKGFEVVLLDPGNVGLDGAGGTVNGLEKNRNALQREVSEGAA